MRKKEFQSAVSFERLELKRLLAADCGAAFTPDFDTDATIQVASMDTSDQQSTTDSAAAENSESPVVMLDLSDGMDGFFGVIDAENPSSTLQFTAPADGIIQIATSSSLAESHASLQLTGPDGEALHTTETSVVGFDILTVEVTENETYQLTITASATWTTQAVRRKRCVRSTM